MPQSILVIHGLALVPEHDFYLDALSNNHVLKASGSQLNLVDFAYGTNPQPVIRALDSGHHTAAIVCDIATTHKKFTSLLGTALKRFVYENAGRLVFTTTEGLQLNKVLNTLFQVPWTQGSYYRTTWGARPDTLARLDQDFPIRNFLPDAKPASALSFSAKACYYLNVPKEDRCYGITEDSQHESLSMVLIAQPPPDLGPRTPEDPYGESEKSHVSVAARNCGAGKICYFGDVNAETATVNLAVAFCLA